MTTIAQNLRSVQARMHAACEAHGRAAGAVQLLAVSKTHGADAIRAAHAAGQRAFGENYVQEAVQKITQLAELRHGEHAIAWHCIGPIQSNKARLVAQHFDWVHTVDRLKIAELLSEHRAPGDAELQVLLQVNVDGGANKSGVAPDEALALARAVAPLPGLRLRGIMAIPEPTTTFDEQHHVFCLTRALFDQLKKSLGASTLDFDTLSLGMSDDLEAAIAAGSTLVRVGTAVFGERLRPASA